MADAVLVVGPEGQEAYLVECTNVVYCGSEPFLSNIEYTPSVRVNGLREPLCRACAERLYERLQTEEKQVPEIDWVAAYPTWTEVTGDSE